MEEVEEVIVKDAYKKDRDIIIEWDTKETNILGFQVVFRLFGSPEFKRSPPLASSEKDFTLKNVPANVSV